jgi:hypothetical protein
MVEAATVKAPLPPPCLRAEAGCGQGWTQPALDFALTAHAADGSRPFTANMGWLSPMTPTNMSALLDVMGFSHAGSDTIDKFHRLQPQTPTAMTECCSCETQRGEDADLKAIWDPSVFYGDENSGCVRDQTQTSNAVDWMAGTFVWCVEGAGRAQRDMPCRAGIVVGVMRHTVPFARPVITPQDAARLLRRAG